MLQLSDACTDHGERALVTLATKIKVAQEAASGNTDIAALYSALPISSICAKSDLVKQEMDTLEKEQKEISSLEDLVQDTHYSQLIETTYELIILILKNFLKDVITVLKVGVSME